MVYAWSSLQLPCQLFCLGYLDGHTVRVRSRKSSSQPHWRLKCKQVRTYRHIIFDAMRTQCMTLRHAADRFTFRSSTRSRQYRLHRILETSEDFVCVIRSGSRTHYAKQYRTLLLRMPFTGRQPKSCCCKPLFRFELS